MLPVLWLFVRDDLYSKIRELPDFPNSSLTSETAVNIFLRDSGQAIIELEKLLNNSVTVHRDFESVDGKTGTSLELSEKIQKAMNKFGSDKANIHNYQILYAEILQQYDHDNLEILEIGIGSNNPKIPSNMGKSGIPGASLRAWASLFKNAIIIGADIDESILFNEGKIKTFHVDQTNTSSLERLSATLNIQCFDLIIDDGLHSPSANIRTFNALKNKLKSNGTYIIEDIPRRSLPYWKVFSQLPLTDYKISIQQVFTSFVVVITRK